MKCCDISVRAFMAAMFNQQYEGVGGIENWELVFTEYVDLSGIGETAQYELLTNIHNTQLRISKVAGLIELEKDFFTAFNEPFMQAFDDFKKLGHRLVWDAGNPKQFIDQLQAVETREKKYKAELDMHMKELESLKTDGVKVDTNSRASFVKTLNRLGKHGYKIDKDKTDMEELSLMIREYDEEIEQRVIDNEKKQD